MKWNPELYQYKHDFVAEYGKGLIDYLPENRMQVILDLGCGTGTLTKELSMRADKVIGIDESEAMIKRAKRSYPDLDFMRLNACEMQWKSYFDVVFSNAVFHWIPEQKKLLHNIFEALKKDGMLICEFGAEENIGMIEGAFKRVLNSHGFEYKSPFYFPSAKEYEKLLEDEGFDIKILFEYKRPTRLRDGEAGLRNWMKMFFAGALAKIPDEISEQVFSEVENDLKVHLWDGNAWTADYRRLRVIAKK